MSASVVGLEAVRVGVTGDIKPVAAPALSVMRRREQAVDYFLPCFRRCVLDKILKFLHRRRDACDVERDAAQQCGPVGGGVGLKAFGFQLFKNERIDFVLHPTGLFAHGDSGFHHRLNRPPALLRCGEGL